MDPLLIYKIIYLTTVLSSTIFALFIFTKTSKEKFNILYASMNVAVVIWALSRYALLVASSHATALLSARMLHIGSILVHLFFLHSILVFVDKEDRRWWLLAIIYLNALFGLFINFNDIFWQTGFFVKDVVPKLIFPWVETGGSLYNLHLINELVIPMWAFVEIVLGYMNAKGIKKSQLMYIMLSSFLGFIGGNTVIFLIYDIKIMPYGVWLVPISFITMTYAIFRYKLMNFKTLVTELLVFALLIILLFQTVIAQSFWELIRQGSLFIIVSFVGYLLIQGVLKEVKTREKMEKLATQLEKANTRLRKLDKAKSDFVTIASHQLRTPITAIKGYSSMLLEGSYGKFPSEAKTPLNRILVSSKRLVLLINEFLNLSRIERGKMKYVFDKSDLAEIAKTLMDEFSVVLRKDNKKKIKLELDIEKGKDFNIKMDADKIRQVVSNLIDNAIKYNGGQLKRKSNFVKVSLRQKKKNVVLKVTDSGIGINKDDLATLFQKFSRADSHSSQNANGSGLGLFVAKEIMKAHKGKIWAESPGEGKGSSFCLEIPIC